MLQQKRSEGGKFTAKSSSKREVRSVRMTDEVWQRLNELAAAQNCTAADLIEQWTALGKSTSNSGLDQVDEGITHVLNDPTVTRNGKDRGSVRRALEALRNFLASPV